MAVTDNIQPSRLVAEQILWLRSQREAPTTPMHVIKLVYLCHGWMLGIYRKCLIDEPAEAWRYGPVIPSIYHTYKSFRGGPITTPPIDRSDSLENEQKDIIGGVVEAYIKFDAWMLSSITHQPDTPWAKVYRGGRGEGAIIPNEVIQEHYEKRANNTPAIS